MAAKKDKELKEPETEGNKQDAQGIQGIAELLQAIAQSQQELSDRLSDLEEMSHTSGNDLSKIHIAALFFKPEDKYLPDFSWISPLAAEPLAEALTLNMMTSEEARQGKISLNTELIYNWLHLQRGVRGRLMGVGKEALEAQVSAEISKGEEEMPEFEAGRE